MDVPVTREMVQKGALRGFFFGMIVGGIVGGATTFAVLTKPWQGSGEVVVPQADAAPVPKSGKKKRRKRRRRRNSAGSGAQDQPVSLSAADRQLVWKGPGIRLPAKNIDFEGASGRALEQGEIDRGIKAGASAVIGCIEKTRGNAELRAKITLKLLVGPDGRVKARRIHAPSYLQANGLYRCVTTATNRMRFDAVGAHTVVTVPFDLE